MAALQRVSLAGFFAKDDIVEGASLVVPSYRDEQRVGLGCEFFRTEEEQTELEQALQQSRVICYVLVVVTVVSLMLVLLLHAWRFRCSLDQKREFEQIRRTHEMECAILRTDHEREFAQARTDHEREFAQIRKVHEKEFAVMRSRAEEAWAAARAAQLAHLVQRNALKEELAAFQAQHREMKQDSLDLRMQFADQVDRERRAVMWDDVSITESAGPVSPTRQDPKVTSPSSVESDIEETFKELLAETEEQRKIGCIWSQMCCNKPRSQSPAATRGVHDGRAAVKPGKSVSPRPAARECKFQSPAPTDERRGTRFRSRSLKAGRLPRFKVDKEVSVEGLPRSRRRTMLT